MKLHFLAALIASCAACKPRDFGVNNASESTQVQVSANAGQVQFRNGLTVARNYTLDQNTIFYFNNLFQTQSVPPNDDKWKKYLGNGVAQGLSLIESYSLLRSTSEDYSRFQAYFSNAKIPTSDVGIWQSEENIRTFILGTMSAVTKLPFHHGTIYRGIVCPVATCLPTVQVGLDLVQRSFTSASKSRKQAELFADPNVAKGGAHPAGSGSFLFVIENSQSAHDISKVTWSPEEEEVLYSPNQTFRITGLTHLPNKGAFPAYLVTMVEK
jgi:hypothetical protein